MLLGSYIIFLLRGKLLFERLIEVMGTALVGKNFLQNFIEKFNLHEKKSLTCSSPKLKSIEF